MNPVPFDLSGPAPTVQQQPRPLTIYLCGPIQGRSDSECRDWRNWVKENWAGQCRDPMDRDYRNLFWKPEQAAGVVEEDLSDINLSDGVLAYYDRPSVGTSMEIFYAAVVRRMPVFLINASGVGTGYLSPWLLHHVVGIAENLEPVTLDDVEHEIRRRIA